MSKHGFHIGYIASLSGIYMDISVLIYLVTFMFNKDILTVSIESIFLNAIRVILTLALNRLFFEYPKYLLPYQQSKLCKKLFLHMQVNGRPVFNMTHGECVREIKNSGQALRLECER